MRWLRKKLVLQKKASFRKNEDGAYAIEFAMVSVPFFLLIFAILELGLLFLANHLVDLGTSKASRLIRVGSQPTVAEFREEICNTTSILVNCANLNIDVRSYTDFSALQSANLNPETNPDGSLPSNYALGNREEFQLVRVSYDYTMFFGKIIPSNNGTDKGRRLSAAFVFRNEPW